MTVTLLLGWKLLKFAHPLSPRQWQSFASGSTGELELGKAARIHSGGQLLIIVFFKTYTGTAVSYLKMWRKSTGCILFMMEPFRLSRTWAFNCGLAGGRQNLRGSKSDDLKKWFVLEWSCLRTRTKSCCKTFAQHEKELPLKIAAKTMT